MSARWTAPLALGLSGCIWLTDAQLEAQLDPDGDGVQRPDDCDDGDVNVGMPATVYLDRDGDGYGDAAQTGEDCAGGDGLWVAQAGDCDDGDGAVNPSAAEVCDDIDDDCDGAQTPCDGALAEAAVVLTGRPGSGAASSFYAGADLTGDGAADLVVGAWQEDNGGAEAGAAYVVAGPLTPSTSALETAAYATFRGQAASGMALGVRVQAGGDFDGDGYADLAIGAHKLYLNRSEQGGAWLMHGPLVGGETELAIDSGPSWYGERSNDRAGYSLALDDLDGDGRSELVIGDYGYDDKDDSGTILKSAVGRVYIVQGTDDDVAGSHPLAESDAVYLEGDHADQGLGVLMEVVGDLDGDGQSELGLLCPDDSTGGAAAGALYLLFDLPSESAPVADVAVAVLGREAGAGAGMAVSRAGDADGDGDEDLWVGESKADDNGADAGAVVLAEGPFSPDMASFTLGSTGVRVLGTAEEQQVGSDLAGGQDLDGDGQEDLAVGAIGASSADGEVGAVWILPGPAQGVTEYGEGGQRYWGAYDHANAGRPVRATGALSADGSVWLLVGASGDDQGGDGAGALFGVAPTGP